MASYENFAVFSVSQFQYVILALVFAKGAPYREHTIRNLPLVADTLLLVAFNLYLSVWPDWWPAAARHFELFAPPRRDMAFR